MGRWWVGYKQLLKSLLTDLSGLFGFSRSEAVKYQDLLIDLTVLLDRVQSTEKLPGTRFTRVPSLLSAPTRALSSGR